MKDEWTDLANFLQEMIEKYYGSFDLASEEIDIVASRIKTRLRRLCETTSHKHYIA